MDIRPLFPEIPQRLTDLDGLILAGNGASRLQVDIDHAIQTLGETTIQLKLRRNACSPILRLPAELTSNILRILEDADPPTIGYTLRDRHSPTDAPVTWTGNLGWLRLTHVCRALRTALLQRSDLWARNIYRFPQIMDQILPRCSDHPLSLRLDGASAYTKSHGLPLRVTLDSLGRAASLIVDDPLLAIDAGPVDPSIFSQRPFPHLKELTLKTLHHDEDTLTSDICDLPRVSAPLLRSLTLENYMISFTATTLTHLSMVFDPPLYLYSSGQFLDMLRSGAQLEHLELVNCLPLLGTLRGENLYPALVMPNLTYMELGDDIERCLRMWKCFSVDPETSVVIYLRNVAELYPAPNSYFDAIPTYFSDWVACSAPGLTVCEHKDTDGDRPGIRDVSVHLCVPCPGARLAHWDGGIFERDYLERRQLFFEAVDCSQLDFVRAVSAAHAITDVASTTALELANRPPRDPSTWTSILKPFSSVETLYVENTATWAVIIALMASQDEETPLLLPRLRCLWLSHLVIFDESFSTDCTRAHLIRILVSRAKRGAVLQDLRVDALIINSEAAAEVLASRVRLIVPSFQYTPHITAVPAPTV